MAFSFSGAQRSKVREVAEELERELGDGTIFFDEWFEPYVAGGDADLRLQDIYLKQSDLVIVCVSSSYNDRPWTQLEHSAIRAFTMQVGRQSPRVLPLRFGQGDVDGILINAIVLDVRERSANDISRLIIARLEQCPATPVSSRESENPRLSASISEGAITSERAIGQEGVPFDLERFKRLKEYAYSAVGLNLDQAGAIAWAEQKVRKVPPFDLERFRQLKDYAYSATGLNLDHRGAIEWAEQKVAELSGSTSKGAHN